MSFLSLNGIKAPKQRSLRVMVYVLFCLISAGVGAVPAGARTSADAANSGEIRHRAPSAQAGFVKLPSGQELYVEYLKADPGKSILVILNGLTYTVRSWDPIMKNLVNHGYGILRYDPRGMGKTLLRYAPVRENIAIETQVEDLAQLLDKMEIRQKVSFVGLSYGGGLGIAFASKYPERTDKLILMAPYVAPLASQDQMIRSQIMATRMMYPYNPLSDDELYEFYLRNIVYSTYPSAEPVILENPYKLEAVFRMTCGIRKFLSVQHVANLPKGSFHLLTGEFDQYIPTRDHDNFWAAVPKSVKGSHLVVRFSEHKIPEAYPRFAAAWINEIMAGNSQISRGRDFRGNPFTGEVEGDRGEFTLSLGE